MADEMVGVLQELSSLLRRLTEQNDAKLQVTEEMRLRGRTRIDESRARMDELRANVERMRQARSDFPKMREETARRIEETREEDLKFRQRLLQEIERHNQLLETLIAKMGRS